MLRNIQTNFFCFFIYTKLRKQSYNAKADQCTDNRHGNCHNNSNNLCNK